MIEVRWHARGGQGGFTAAKLLGLAASVFEDNYAQAFPSFGPERRGAPVLGFTRIDDNPIDDHSQVYECDYVVVLDETLMEVVNVTNGLKNGGILLINTEAAPESFKLEGNFKVVTLNATDIALNVLKAPITNTTMMGALVAVSGIVGIESVLNAIDAGMPENLREKNKKAVMIAYDAVRGVK